APSRRWVLKMTTTSVGFFTLRYGTYLCSRPIRGRYWERGGMGCPLWPTLPAVLRAVHEFQSGPRFIHSADLHVDEALGQGDGAHDILSQVGRDSGCPLRPRDPEAPIWRESVFPRQEPSGQVRASPNERVDHVDAAVQPFADCHALWKSAQQSNIVMRRMDHDHDEALFDPELLRQRFRRRTRGHRRGLAPSATEHVLARARQVSGIEYLFRFVGGSRFEWVFATAIATSLPITVTPTCMTASGITGLTLPGMIEEPGWTAGRFSSRKPVWGPDPSHRRSYAIFIIEIATVRIAPLASTSASRAAWASK